MKKAFHYGLPLVFSLMFVGCADSAETNTTTAKGEKSMAQVIELHGSKVAEISDEGEVWIGGDKEGRLTEKGEIWVAGEKEGDLTKDGGVWKAGDKIGDITSKGAVWKDSNEVGTVEADGTIWIGSSREGRFKGGDRRHAAVIVFYGFFKLED